MNVKNDKIFSLYDDLVKTSGVLPIKVTNFYNLKIKAEVAKIGTEGPLYRCSFPTEEKVGLSVAGEMPDYVRDKNNMPKNLGNFLIQKYDDRVLLLLSEKCFGHCQYCFRTQLLSVGQSSDCQSIENSIGEIVKYIKKHNKIREVIFSGGDPLFLGPDRLKKILGRIAKDVDKINFRIHTRSIVYCPEIFNEKLCSVLKKHQVRLVFHIAHPYEICDKVEKKIDFISSFGIRMYNQFPILRNINDHEQVLAKLLEKIDQLGVRQLSIFITDPISYGASFRMPLKRVFAIIDKLNMQYPSWINSFRLVLDTPIGKVRRENIISWNKKTGIVIFERGKQTVSYHDFPAELDKPGEIKKLLWKN